MKEAGAIQMWTLKSAWCLCVSKNAAKSNRLSKKERCLGIVNTPAKARPMADRCNKHEFCVVCRIHGKDHHQHKGDMPEVI